MKHPDSPILDDLISQFPLDELFDELPETDDTLVGDDATAASSPDSISSWIDELERFLMKDDVDDDVIGSSWEFSDSFLAELQAESPEDASRSGEVVLGPSDRDSDVSTGQNNQLEKEKEKVEGEATVEDDVDEDSVSKKRRRQLRNKDAAARSRDRKKTYVKELEMKSKYLEGECRRLGRLLQCFVSENQALRLGLQNGHGLSAKQESAVLLLESLLLGSLLWFLAITCLFSLPVPPPSTVSQGNAGRTDLRSCSLSAPRNDKLQHSLLESFLTSRKCRASRSKMKPGILIPRVVAYQRDIARRLPSLVFSFLFICS